MRANRFVIPFDSLEFRVGEPKLRDPTNPDIRESETASLQESDTWYRQRFRAQFSTLLATEASKAELLEKIRTYSRGAFKAGLRDVGVSPSELTEEDSKTINDWIEDQRAYLDNLDLEEDFDTDSKAEMWWNKSVYPMYAAGMRSGRANAMMEWVWNPEKEHCDTCSDLDGQVHRMNTFMKYGLLPKSDRLDCGGFRCGCKLVPTIKRANGRLITVRRGHK